MTYNNNNKKKKKKKKKERETDKLVSVNTRLLFYFKFLTASDFAYIKLYVFSDNFGDNDDSAIKNVYPETFTDNDDKDLLFIYFLAKCVLRL